MDITLSPAGHFLLRTGETTELEIPVSEAGARALYTILHARQYIPRPKIATPA